MDSPCPPKFAIDVVDLIIEEGAVPAIAAFFASIAPGPSFPFRAWNSTNFKKASPFSGRWNDVHTRINEAIRQRS